jgi:hypothetical protein
MIGGNFMRRLGLLVGLSVVALAIGCGDTGGSAAKKGPAPSSASAKTALEDMAKTGMRTSGTMAVGDYINSLRKTDAAKADELDKDFKDLGNANGDALKAKAKAMADKL